MQNLVIVILPHKPQYFINLILQFSHSCMACHSKILIGVKEDYTWYKLVRLVEYVSIG
jgi:hypothetical protein